MKITLHEIRGLNAGINAIMVKELPPETANKFSQLMVKFVLEMQAQERIRGKLAMKYAEKGEDGKPLFKRDKKGRPTNEYDVTKENRIKLGVEWDRMGQEEIEIPFEPLEATREVFGETITADMLYQLGKLVEE